jgi:hypothetical protein
MDSNFGLQVDAWGALIMGKAGIAAPLEQDIVTNIQAKQLPDLEVGKQNVSLEGAGEAREHVVFQEKLKGGGLATVALRIVPHGAEDLQVSWRLFERNPGKQLFSGMSQSMLVFWGAIITAAGVVTSIFGYGLCLIVGGVAMIGMGLGWWGKSRGKTTASAYEQFDSRVLAQSVDFALMRSLATLGVAQQELRVLRQSSMTGLGNLTPFLPIDGLRAG